MGDGPSRSAWIEPATELVGPGVYRIPLPLPTDGLRAVNVYAIEDSDGLVLIDSGWPIADSRARLEAGLAEIGYDFRQVTRFLITHAHRDHYAQSLILRREFGSRVALGLGEQASLRSVQGVGEPLERQIFQLLRAGAVDLVNELRALGLRQARQEEWEDPDVWLTEGDELELADRRLTVMATPGHTAGHVVFIDHSNRLLFAGDHVLPHITPSIGFEAGNEDGLPLANYLHSLSRTLTLSSFRLLPAHGPILEHTGPRVCELLGHHGERLARTLACVSEGRRTAYEVADGLPWTRRERPFETLDPMNRMLATTETKAHLDMLVQENLLQVETVEGVDRYSMPDISAT